MHFHLHVEEMSTKYVYIYLVIDRTSAELSDKQVVL